MFKSKKPDHDMCELNHVKLQQYLAPMEKQCFAPRTPIGFPLPHKETFDTKIKELMTILGINTKERLAEFLSVKIEEINAARENKEIPPNWLVRLWEVAHQVK